MLISKPYPDFEIRFDDEGRKHSYTVHQLSTDREWSPLSVTKITSILDKPALIPWAVKMTAQHLIDLLDAGQQITVQDVLNAKQAHVKARDTAAGSGTAVHDWIERFVKRRNPPMPTEEAVKNGVQAFLDWFTKTDAEIVQSESLVYSVLHDYVGKIDAVVKIGSQYHVLDYKTGSGLYNEARYQTAAYQHALTEMDEAKNKDTKIVFGNRIIIRLDKITGEFQEYELPDYDRDFHAFWGLSKVAKREAELKQENKK